MKVIFADRPVILFHYFRMYALLGLIPFLINTFDVLLNVSAPALDQATDPITRALMGLIVAPLILVIAILCIRRVPGNLIGWLLVAFAYGVSVKVMRIDLLPLTAGVFFTSLVIEHFWFAFIITPLYFPNDRLFPESINRWGNSLILLMVTISHFISMTGAPTLSWGSGSNTITISNPTFLFEWDYTLVTIPLMSSLIVAGIVTTVLRYRSSRNVERLQLRWLLFGVLFQGVITVLTFWVPPWFDRISTWVTGLYFLIIPLAAGIAILRYRLYDIDLIIRRTMQYGLLSVLLGLIYFAMVILLGQLLQGVTGQESPLVIVISTLLIAALFNPLRRRVQQLIDRRFFRLHYDTGQALERFSQNLRNQVDLLEIKREVAQVVQETVQPEQVFLWIREVEKK